MVNKWLDVVQLDSSEEFKQKLSTVIETLMKVMHIKKK